MTLNWRSLGTATPIPERWTAFPLAGEARLTTLKVRCILNTELININSWTWLRATYTAAGETQVSRAFRIYPKLETQIIQVITPRDFLGQAITERRFEVRKGYRRRARIGILVDSNWSIELQEQTAVAAITGDGGVSDEVVNVLRSDILRVEGKVDDVQIRVINVEQQVGELVLAGGPLDLIRADLEQVGQAIEEDYLNSPGPEFEGGDLDNPSGEEAFDGGEY